MASNSPSPEPARELRLEQITTVWSALGDPARFVMRYAPAIRSYFLAIIPHRHDAEEAIQDFLLRAVTVGFIGARSDRGRFRDYLKAAARNAALAHLRRESARRRNERASGLERSMARTRPTLDQHWLRDWRQ